MHDGGLEAEIYDKNHEIHLRQLKSWGLSDEDAENVVDDMDEAESGRDISAIYN